MNWIKHKSSLLVLNLLTIAFFIPAIHLAETDDRVLAVVNGQAITIADFRDRYEGVLWPSRHIKSWTEHLKTQVLLSMIAERLLAEEAAEAALMHDPEVGKILASLERALIRDRLYREEVKDKVTVAEVEILEAYQKASSARVVRLVRVTDKTVADALLLDLHAGADLDTLALYLDKTRTLLTTMQWGQSPAHVDSVIFSLSLEETSRPFPWDGLYYFAKLKKIMSSPLFDEQDYKNQHGQIKKTLQDRKEQVRFAEFLPTLERGQAATIKHETLKLLIDRVTAVVQAYSDSFPDLNDPLSFTFGDLKQVQDNLQSHLNDPIVVFDDQNWTLFDLFERYKIHGLAIVPALDIPGQVVNSIKEQIDSLWLTMEGYRRELDQHPQVLADMEKWQRFYLANLNKMLLRASLDSTITQPMVINVREILLATMDEAERILQQLAAGANFAELARNNTIRPGFAERDGELGYFDPNNNYPEIGKIAAGLSLGERFGPLPLAAGYSIFELIDKKIPTVNAITAFQSTDIYQPGNSLLNEHIKELAVEYGISIDFRLLKSIPVSTINIFTVRYLGFGGTIPAIPQLEPLHNWYNLMNFDQPQ